MPELKRIRWYRNQVVLSRLLQASFLCCIVAICYYLGSNAVSNMAARGVVLSLDFIGQEAPFKVGFTPFWNYELGQTQYWEVFLIGIQNTLLVSIAGVVGATLLGFAVGVARLSENWFLSKFAAIYVEIFRNIPLLLQVFFWYFVLVLPSLPRRKDSIQIWDAIVVNKEGIFTPSLTVDGFQPLGVFLIAIAICVALIKLLSNWSNTQFEETGRKFPVILGSLTILCLGILAAYAVSRNFIAVEKPQVGSLSVSGGYWIPISLFSLWLSLVSYTAAFIAENVRGGIQSVSKGQLEASQALGFHAPLSMKLILVPQAMRVIIPPSISQYLNLIKNSSLAVAIGYDDLVNVWMGVSLNQTGQAIAIIAMTMGVFTTLSLLTSFILNAYNARAQLQEG